MFRYSSFVLQFFLTFTIGTLKSSQVHQLQKSNVRLQIHLHTFTYLSKALFNWAPCKLYLQLSFCYICLLIFI